MPDPSGCDPPTRIVLAGTYGFGGSYVRRIAELAAAGAVELVGLCDPRPPAGEVAELAAGVPWAAELAGLLDLVRTDVVVIAAPIHAHSELAEIAFRAGADVLLEKPPTPTLAAFDHLVALASAAGRRCQVGFQSFGSPAIDHVREMVASGRIGRVRGIGALGAWVRPLTYWARSPWAGRRQLDGRVVVDGVVTNPLAHAVATALRIDGSDRRGDLLRIETELFRANDIEADDTSCLRLTTRRGTTIIAALTLCAPTAQDPYVVVHGTEGRVVMWYKSGRVEATTATGTSIESFPFTDLLVNLLEHRHGVAVPLVSPLERSGAFSEVLEAVRTAPSPVPISPEHLTLAGDGPARHVVVDDVLDVTERAIMSLRTFTELGAAWASTGPAFAQAGTAAGIWENEGDHDDGDD